MFFQTPWAYRGELLATSSPLPPALHQRCLLTLRGSQQEVAYDEDTGVMLLDDRGQPLVVARTVTSEVTLMAELFDRFFYPRGVATPSELREAGFHVYDPPAPPRHPEMVAAQNKLTLRSGGQREAFEGLVANDGGSVILGTGRGKTVTLLYTACHWAQPTLAIFNNGGLLKQWHEVIQKMLGIEAGICTGPPSQWDWKGKAFGLITYQSLVPHLQRGNVSEEFVRHWGTIVWDEGHHATADTWATSLSAFPARRVVLTATPGRDGSEKILFAHAGLPVVWDVTPDLVPDCYMAAVETSSAAPTYSRGDVRAWGREAGRVLGGGKNNAPPDRKYLDALVQRLLLMEAQGRVVLVHCVRTSIIRALKKSIPSAAVIDQTTPMRRRPQVLKSSNIVLLSAQCGEEGLDRCEADTVVLTFPLGRESLDRLRQAGGRALRPSPEIPKFSPEIWVFFPKGPYGAGLAERNQALLEELSFRIKSAVRVNARQESTRRRT